MPTWEEVIAEDDSIVELDAVVAHPNFLVFGASGSGKTVLACSDERVLLLTCEPEGSLSARRLGAPKSVRQKIINEWDQLEDFYEKLASWADTKDGIPFTWIVIDTLSDAQGLLFDKLLEERKKIVEDWPEYRLNQKMLLRFVKKMNQLPVNILWLAWARKEEDADGEDFWAPDIHGKGYNIAMQVAAQMTSYGYLQVQNRTEKVTKVVDDKTVDVINPKTKKPRVRMVSDRYIYWQDMKEMKGKDRTLALAPYTKNLTLKQIRERVEKAFAESSSGAEEPSKTAQPVAATTTKEK